MQTITDIANIVSARQREIHTDFINLSKLTVEGKRVKIGEQDYYIDRDDEYPIKQLCSSIKMNLGFYRDNQSALNQRIFDEKFGYLGEGGDRIVRFRETKEGRKILSFVPTSVQCPNYADVLNKLKDVSPNAVVSKSNHDTLDTDHQLHLRATPFDLKFLARKDDECCVEYALGTSEDGLSKFQFYPSILRLVCLNGAHATHNGKPYINYNYKGIDAKDLTFVFSSALRRFNLDFESMKAKVIASVTENRSRDSIMEALDTLEYHKHASTGFIRRLKSELQKLAFTEMSNWDYVNHITERAKELPYSSQIQHEFLAGSLLGLNIKLKEAEAEAE